MLRRFVTAAIAAAVLALVPFPAAAQSLGEVAAREKAKKKPAQPAKVLTEDDARRAKGQVVIAPAPEEPAKPATDAAKPEGAAAAPAKPEPTEDEKRAEAEKEWREKLQAAQAEVARLKLQVEQIQTGLNDPNLGYYGSGRASLSTKMDEVKKQLVTAEQAVVDLEDTGRRSRYRP